MTDEPHERANRRSPGWIRMPPPFREYRREDLTDEEFRLGARIEAQIYGGLIDGHVLSDLKSIFRERLEEVEREIAHLSKEKPQ